MTAAARNLSWSNEPSSLHYVLPNNFIQVRNDPLQCGDVFGSQLRDRLRPINPFATTISQFQSQIIQCRGEDSRSWNRETTMLKVQPRPNRRLFQVLRVVIVGKLGIIRIILYVGTQSPHSYARFLHLCPGRVSELGERNLGLTRRSPDRTNGRIDDTV